MGQFLFLEIEELEEHLDRSDGLSLVHFGTPLVSACSFTQRSLALISPDFGQQVQFATVDVPLQEIDVLRQYSLRTVPTLVLFDGGREVERLERILLPAELRLFLQDAVAFYGIPLPAPGKKEPGSNS